MTAAAPLRILLFRHPNDPDVRPFEDAIVRVIQGGKDAGAYVAAGAGLGVQLELFANAPPLAADRFLDNFRHTLVVVFVDHGLLGAEPSLFTWLKACFRHVSETGDRHGILVLALEERLGERFAECAGLGERQVATVQAFGERALRPGMVALRVLHEARVLLAAAMPRREGEPVGYLKLFISHAKLDGLPLAQSLQHHIRQIGWLRSFYDAEDLPAGSEWRRELERAVGACVIVMLRTEGYDERYWCQQEVKWADEYATPAVLVEARTGLDHPASGLPFDRAPSVRIPDGNLMRILFRALQEGLRFLLFVRRVEDLKRPGGPLPAHALLRVFSSHPSMAALLRASRELAVEAGDRYILYPDPPLATGDYEAARALVAIEAPGVVLATPETLAAAGS